MPSRTFSSGTYRYGFNGKENDKDISEGGQDYGMRVYDNRLGKFLSVDPLGKEYCFYTPYQFAGNAPVGAIDVDGLEGFELSSHINQIKQQESYYSSKIESSNQVSKDNITCGMNLGALKMQKKSYEGTAWNSFNPTSTKQFTFANNAVVSGWNQAVSAVEDGTKCFTKSGRQELQKNTLKTLYKGFQWLVNTTDAEKLEDVRSVTTNVNTYEDLVGTIILSEAINSATTLQKISGSGPVSGVLEVSNNVKSAGAFKNFKPSSPVEFVYDPANKKFLVGQPNQPLPGLSGHQSLVKVGNLNPNKVVGGMFKVGKNGEIITNEFSGHYHQNWTKSIRDGFKKFIKEKTGKNINHKSS